MKIISHEEVEAGVDEALAIEDAPNDGIDIRAEIAGYLIGIAVGVSVGIALWSYVKLVFP